MLPFEEDLRVEIEYERGTLEGIGAHAEARGAIHGP